MLKQLGTKGKERRNSEVVTYGIFVDEAANFSVEERAKTEKESRTSVVNKSAGAGSTNTKRIMAQSSISPPAMTASCPITSTAFTAVEQRHSQTCEFSMMSTSSLKIFTEFASTAEDAIARKASILMQNEYDRKSRAHQWDRLGQDTADEERCHGCQVYFKSVLFVRKHHCRSCRHIYCHQCCQRKEYLHDRGFESKVYVCKKCLGHMYGGSPPFTSESHVKRRKTFKLTSPDLDTIARKSIEENMWKDFFSHVLNQVKCSLNSHSVGVWGGNKFGQYRRVLAADSILDIAALIGRVSIRQVLRDILRCRIVLNGTAIPIHAMRSSSSAESGTSSGRTQNDQSNYPVLKLMCEAWEALSALTDFKSHALCVCTETVEYLRIILAMVGQGCMAHFFNILVPLYQERSRCMLKNCTDLSDERCAGFAGSLIEISMKRGDQNLDPTQSQSSNVPGRSRFPILTVSHTRPFDVRFCGNTCDEPSQQGVLLLKVEAVYQALDSRSAPSVPGGSERAPLRGIHALRVYVREDE